MSVTVEGLIERDARYYRSTGDRALVVVQVHAAFGHPFEASVDFGASLNDHAFAERTARTIRKGMVARIDANSITHRADHGNAVYVLGGGDLAVVVHGDGGPMVDITQLAQMVR